MLRAKYKAERDKRLRDDGEDQYVEASAEFAHYADDDPYADENFEREPLDVDLDVVVIGAGFSGLMTAARLKERDRFRKRGTAAAVAPAAKAEPEPAAEEASAE